MSAEKTAAEEALIVAALKKDAAFVAYTQPHTHVMFTRCYRAHEAYEAALAAVKQERGA